MKASLSDECGTSHELHIGLSNREIDLLIHGLQKLKGGQDHFHCFQKDWKGGCGVYNIEFSCTGDEESQEMEVELAPPIFPDESV